jgi:predicted porin
MKNIRFGALACATVVTSVAHAQGSVTLYGVLDAGIGYVNSVATSPSARGGHKFQAVSGIGTGDRFGLRGSEDLGDGNSAIFVLEDGFNVFNGTSLQGGRLFGRQAFAGLSSRKAGSITFGRQYDSVVDFVSPTTSAKQWGTQYGAHVGDIDNLYNAFRINNSVKYTSAAYDGFAFGGLYGFSNQASGVGSGFADNRAWSVGGKYVGGDLTSGVGYLHVDHPSSSNANGAVAGDYSSATNIFYAKPVDKQDVVAAAASYRLRAFTVGAVYSYSRLRYSDGSSLRMANYEVNGRYQLSPALVMGTAFIYSDGHIEGATGLSGVSKGERPRWVQINAGVEYALSARTSLYTAMVWQRAQGDALTAAIDNVGGASGGNSRYQFAALAGIRSKF